VADVGGVRFILDYGHNPASMAALANLVRRIRSGYRRALGLVCIPADRRDQDVRAFIVAAVPAFDILLLREDLGFRGRKRGEMLALQRPTAIEAGLSAEHIVTRVHEHDAVGALIAEARPGDLVVLTVTDIVGNWA
jgi:cyanophycin synthetase